MNSLIKFTSRHNTDKNMNIKGEVKILDFGSQLFVIILILCFRLQLCLKVNIFVFGK